MPFISGRDRVLAWQRARSSNGMGMLKPTRAIALALVLSACAGRPPAVTLPPPKPPTAHAAEPPKAPPKPPDAAAARESTGPEPLAEPATEPATEPPSPCPKEMALVSDDVCIDRWEASIVVVEEDGNETPWSPFISPREAKKPFRSVSRPGVIPQGYVSGEDAETACQASGKRLCAAHEWEAACRGGEHTLYPYGNVRQKQTCNDAGRKKHPVAEVHQSLGLPLDRMWYEGMSHPLINQLDNTLRKTGELSECTNDVGTFDMVGNLHEWIEDPAGTFRGGFYMDTLINGEGCDYATTAHPKTYADYSTGFRCCVEADPIE